MKTQRRSLISVLLIALVFAFSASPVLGVGNNAGRAGDVVPDSYIVVLQDGVSSADVASSHRITRGRTFSSVSNGFSGVVPPGRVNALRNDPRVASVSPNRIVSANPKPDNPGGGGGGGNGGGGKNKAPSVTINSPGDGDSFDSGVSISFVGTASDNEDGDVTESLTWESSLDGAIGVDGGPFDAVLSDGDHTVTASVTDSGGKTGSASIGITVGTVSPPSNQVVPSGVTRIGAAPGQLSETGAGVGVAIVDTGIDLGNPDLNHGSDCFTAYASCQDGAGHGTHVAGIVAANDNDVDVVGVAPGATVYAVKVLDDTLAAATT
ncbi:MAG: S8 family serine peptidase [SAR202 cluster bacterium]|nr:S8 family serine peptidase [SAR202 cluster bacterium]|tara:strand:+ start:182 stop:1147 length:966 start_codon:yes stop_codon:yes gene_type:complete